MKRYVWGFPGVGKSTLDIPGLTVVDADSKQFAFKDVAAGDLHSAHGSKAFVRDDRYPQNYLDYVRTVDADVVLLNCHISLLDELGRDNVLLVYPGVELVPEYLLRYQERGDNSSFVEHMSLEAEGMIRAIEGSGFEQYRIDAPNTYLADLFEREDFKVKVMTRGELTEQLQRAIDLGVMVATYQAGDNARLVCNAKYAEMKTEDIQASVNYTVVRAEDAARLADAVLDGKFQLDIDQLIHACITREEAVKEEKMLLARRGGLSREELADKIMQGIVNGALGIRYDEIAPYSHGYEVTFGGIGTIGSTRDFKNRWEVYGGDLFGVPEKIVGMIEKEQQSGRVFGKDVKLLNIQEMLQAIDTMEANKIQGFIPEKDTNFQRSNYPHRLGDVATVMDVHAGKGLDGIVQHHYHGTWSTMTPVKQNDLVETLVFLKGFCLDCIDMLDIGSDGRKKVIDYLKKHGTDISTPEKMRAWIRKYPENCGLSQNREMAGRETTGFGLQPETYQTLLDMGFDHTHIKDIVESWGVEDVEKGYTIFRVSGSDVVVEGALLIEAISEIGRFEDDFEACRQAEKDGVRFINDVDGLEKGCYVDTPENRALCVKMIKEHPGYRIENWLDADSDFGRKYIPLFGSPMEKNEKGLDAQIAKSEELKKEHEPDVRTPEKER